LPRDGPRRRGHADNDTGGTEHGGAALDTVLRRLAGQDRVQECTEELTMKNAVQKKRERERCIAES
jgi:hypothetical protein